jgi:beta-lactam-binding protein with PASTA domain
LYFSIILCTFAKLLQNTASKRENMNIKESLGKVFDRYVVINLSAMLIVGILLCIGVAFGLDVYTHHGENIVVPNLKGVSYDKAAQQLEALGLTIEVNVSGYNKSMPASAILLHTPGAGQKVKEGHIIYVTVNSPSSPAFALPDVIDNSSVREAEAKLNAIGFRLTQPQLVDGEKDWVYGILSGGRRLANGERISLDHPLTLIVGKGTIEDMEDIDMVDADEMQEGTVDDFEEIKEP